MQRRWFLSYNSQDLSLVQGLEGALRRQDPDGKIFFAPKSLRAGGYWLPQLHNEIVEATAFVLLVGEKGIGTWQVTEYYEAFDKHVKTPDFPVILVLLESQPAPGLAFLRQLHWIVSADPASKQCVAQLMDATVGAATRPGELWRFTAPYRGLAAMTEADSDFFFGRTAETIEVLQALESAPDRLPILLGNSGVGKSSLAQAGVLASLTRQAWPERAETAGAWPDAFRDSRRWCLLNLRPGAAPLKALVEPFLKTWQLDPTSTTWAERQEQWIAGLLDGKRTLPELLDATERRYEELGQPKPPAFLLYVDQGEELYVRAEERQRRRFSELLTDGVRDPRLRALMSLRADFLGALQNDEALYEAHRKIDVPPLREEGLRDVVSRPAALLSARFETEGLATDISRRTAEESTKDAGALPLLSYLLDDMWTEMIRRGDGVLRLPAKAFELGGVLADRANAFLASRPGAEGQVRRILTLKLATVRPDGEPTRRRALRSEFSDEEWRLVSELADHPHRLLVTATPEIGETYAEVAHEAIFRRWDKLREWISAEREFLVWNGGFEADRRAWQAAPEPSRNDALLMGLALAQAQDWLVKRAEDLPRADRDFIDLSLKREMLERKQKEQMRRRVYWIGAAALVLVSILAGLLGYQWRETAYQRKTAEQGEQLAQEERDRAQEALETAIELANALVFDMGQDPRLSGLPSEFLSQMFDRAIRSYDRVININPTALAYNGRGAAYRGKKDIDQAIEDYNQAIRLDRKFVIAYYNRSLAFRAKDDLDHAIADDDQAIMLNSNYTLAYIARGDAFAGKKDFDRAIADFDHAITLDPKLAAAYGSRGGAYNAKGDFDHAIADEDQAIMLDPKLAAAYGNRGLAYHAKGDFDHAIADFDHAITLDPKLAPAYGNRGEFYRAKGDLDHAIADADQAIALDPKLAAAYRIRGLAYYAKGDLDHAISDYDQAIGLDPKFAMTYFNRGTVYYDRRDRDHAFADYGEAIRLDPKSASAYNGRGSVYYDKKDYDRAIADYDHAIQLDRNYVGAYSNRGNVYYDQQDYDRAIADYDHAIQLDPKFALAYANRGNAYYDKKEYDRALADYDQAITLDPKQAIRLDPKFALAYNNRGFAYLKLGRLADAIVDFNAALEINSKLASSLYGRGLVKLKKGNHAAANADMAAAKAIKADIAKELARNSIK